MCFVAYYEQDISTLLPYSFSPLLLIKKKNQYRLLRPASVS